MCLSQLKQSLVEHKADIPTHLFRLNIRLSHIDDQTALADLAAALSRSLRALNVTGSGITSVGCNALASQLVAGSRYLTELDLGYNDITKVNPLADALAGNCSLRRLRMRGNAVGGCDAARIFDALRRNYRLEILDMSGNPIGSDKTTSGDVVVARSMTEALICNRTLRQLNLERCMIGVEVCAGVARALRANSTLTALDLSINPEIGDTGVSLLADALRHNQRCAVQTLSLNMCAVSDAGFRSLLEALRGGTSKVKRLKLCYNFIGTGNKKFPSHVDVSQRRTSLITRPRDLSLGPKEFLSSHGWSGRSTPAASGLCDSFREEEELNRLTTADGLSKVNQRDKGRELADRLDESAELLDLLTAEDSSNLAGTAEKNAGRIDPVELNDNIPSSVAVVDSKKLQRKLNGNDSLYNVRSQDASNVRLSEATNNVDDLELGEKALTRAKSNDYVTASSQAVNVDELATRSFSRRNNTLESSPMYSSFLAQQLRRRNASSRQQIGRSASAVISDWTVTSGRISEGKNELKETSQSASLDTARDVYLLLCDVLGANPHLKVLLWGNQRYFVGSPVDSSGEADSLQDVRQDGVWPRHRAYATLPRNYELRTIFS